MSRAAWARACRSSHGRRRRPATRCPPTAPSPDDALGTGTSGAASPASAGARQGTNGTSKAHQWHIKGATKIHQRCIEGTSKEHQRCIKGTSKEHQRVHQQARLRQRLELQLVGRRRRWWYKERRARHKNAYVAHKYACHICALTYTNTYVIYKYVYYTPTRILYTHTCILYHYMCYIQIRILYTHTSGKFKYVYDTLIRREYMFQVTRRIHMQPKMLKP